MGWVNYPDFRMGMLDRGTRLQPEIALRSAASASDVLIDTRGGMVRRPGFENQGVELDTEFVTIPYYSEEETYLLVITYGDNILELGDSITAGTTGIVTHTLPPPPPGGGSGPGTQTWTAGSGAPLAPRTHFKGRIYLYRVDQETAESGLTNQGFVTQQRWATTKGDYIYGPDHSIRRAQGAITLGVAAPDLTNYLHPWTKAQCQGMQHAQYDSRLYLFPPGFPTIEVQRSDRDHSPIMATHTSAVAPHAAPYAETGSTEAANAALAGGGEEWDFAVDVLEPEVSRRASPPINLLLTSINTLIASDDFFDSSMNAGYISFGSTQISATEDATSGHDLCSGVLMRIKKVRTPKKATVELMNASTATPLVVDTYTTGYDIYGGKNLSGQTLVPGDISTLTDSMLGDWCGPWTFDKRTRIDTTGSGASGFVPSYNPTHTNTSGNDPITEGFPEATHGGGTTTTTAIYYHCDSLSPVGIHLKNEMGLSELDVGSIIMVWDSGANSTHGNNYRWLFYLSAVTDTSGGHDFSGTLRYHFQFISASLQADPVSNLAAVDPSDAIRNFDDQSYFYKYSVKAPYVQVGVSGTGNYGGIGPEHELAQTSKQSIHVNDPQFLPGGLQTPNRPIKSGGVYPMTEIIQNSAVVSTQTSEAPLMGGASIFFRNGVFRPTARVSAVCYEGYWERRPMTGAPQSFISIGSGGSTGFASCGAHHQGRFVVGGFSGSFEDAVVFSRTGQPRVMMSPHIDSADDAFSIQLGQTKEEQVQWFGSAQVGLIVGGTTSEYLIRGEPITALKIGFQRISSVGGASIRPAHTDSEVVFVCRDKRALGGVQIQENADSSTFSLRLSDRSTSLFTNDIIQSGYIYSPYPVFFFLMDNGTVLAFTRDQSVGGFTQFTHSVGTIKSLSSAVRSAKSTDSVFCCVKVPKYSSASTSTDKYRLERFNFDSMFDSQRCTGQYSYTFGGVADTASITTTRVRFLDPWAYQTLHVVTVDAAGEHVYRGPFTVEPEVIGSATTHSIDLTGLGLSTAPAKVITGSNFDGVFEPSSVTEVPGYICSYTSGIILGENVSGLTGPKGAVVTVNTNAPAESVSGWINVYNLGHFSRDAGPSFSLKGPFKSTVQSLSVQVESKE